MSALFLAQSSHIPAALSPSFHVREPRGQPLTALFVVSLTLPVEASLLDGHASAGIPWSAAETVLASMLR